MNRTGPLDAGWKKARGVALTLTLVSIGLAIADLVGQRGWSDMGVGLILSGALVAWVTFLYLRSQARSIDRRQP